MLDPALSLGFLHMGCAEVTDMWEHLQAWMVFGVKHPNPSGGASHLWPSPVCCPLASCTQGPHLSAAAAGARWWASLAAGFARWATGFLLPPRAAPQHSVPACSWRRLSPRDGEGGRDPRCCSRAWRRSSQHLHLAQASACMCFVRLGSLCQFFASPLLLKIPKSYGFDPCHVHACFMQSALSSHYRQSTDPSPLTSLQCAMTY